jgi:tetratricopeptide (TPR) repeat protein
MTIVRLVIPCILACAIFLPSVSGELIWDDEIVQRSHVPAFRSIGDLFFPPEGIQEWSAAYYRPLVWFSYLADNRLFGTERFLGHHATAILLHGLSTLLVTLLAMRILRDERYRIWGATAAGAVFAVHPIHVESVAQITGRGDPMAAAFLIASLMLALHHRDRRGAGWALGLSAVSYGLATLSKEVALAAIALLPLLLFTVPEDEGPREGKPSFATRKSWLLPVLIFVGVSVLYFALRRAAGIRAGGALDAGAAELAVRLLRAIGYYGVKAVVTVPQSAFVGETQLFSPIVGVLVISIVSALLALGVRMLRRGSPWMLIGVGWFVATLAPSLATVVRRAAEQPVAERYLYLPSFGIALLAGGAACRAALRPWRVPAVIGLGLLIAAYAWITLDRERVYRDRLTFWTDTVAKAPDQALPLYQLGRALDRAGRREEALQRFQRALGLYEDGEGRALARNSIGTIRMGREEYEAAEGSFLAAIAERSTYATPYFNLGLIYGERADTYARAAGSSDLRNLERAVEVLSAAVKLRPVYPKARYALALRLEQLARAHFEEGRPEPGRRALQLAREHSVWLSTHDDGPLGRYGARAVPRIDELLRRL